MCTFSFLFWCWTDEVTNLFLWRWILLETLDKVSPGIVNWKVANKPPIKLPFKKVENCNQVVKIGKQLKFSLVNIAGNDIVQGNKKLILGMLSVMRISIVNMIAIQKFCGFLELASKLVLSCLNRMLVFLFSLLVAINEIQHSPTSEEPKIPFPWKRNYWCWYSKVG